MFRLFKKYGLVLQSTHNFKEFIRDNEVAYASKLQDLGISLDKMGKIDLLPKQLDLLEYYTTFVFVKQ